MTKTAIKKARTAMTRAALGSGITDHRDIQKFGKQVLKSISKDTVAGVKASITLNC